jgi:hypothetical protein
VHSSAVLALKRTFLATPVEIVITIYGQEGRWTQLFIATVIRAFRKNDQMLEFCPFPGELLASYIACFRPGGIGLLAQNALDLLREILDLARETWLVGAPSQAHVVSIVENSLAVLSVELATRRSASALRCLKALLKFNFSRPQLCLVTEVWEPLFQVLFYGEEIALRTLAWKVFTAAIMYQTRFVDFLFHSDALREFVGTLSKPSLCAIDPLLHSGLSGYSERIRFLTVAGETTTANNLHEFMRELRKFDPDRRSPPAELSARPRLSGAARLSRPY